MKAQEDLDKCEKYILLKCVGSLPVESKIFQLNLKAI